MNAIAAREARPRSWLVVWLLLIAACADSTDETQAAAVCGEGTLPCDLGCVNALTDPSNCGGCDIECPENVSCVDGTCASEEGGVSPRDRSADAVDDATGDQVGGAVQEGSDSVDDSDDAADGNPEDADSRDRADAAADDSRGSRGEMQDAGEAPEVDDRALRDAESDDGAEIDAGIATGASADSCGSDLTRCDDACVDVSTNDAHCGRCGRACPTSATCSGGTCDCGPERSFCGGECVDLQSDQENCGVCGRECIDLDVCSGGECICGTAICDGSCSWLAGDDRNCGECGTVCGLGERCEEGVCRGGGTGDDGCGGLAQNLSLSKVSLYQTIEIPLMIGGAVVEPRDVDVVVGKDALLRVFVEPGDDWTPRELSVRLLLDDGERQLTLYTDAPQTITGASTDEDRDSAFELIVDGDLIRPTTRFAVEVVECGDAPGLDVAAPRYPALDAEALEPVEVGNLRVHFVPFRTPAGVVPDTSAEVIDGYRAALRAAYPVDDVEATLGEPFDVDNASAIGWEEKLQELRELRQSESPDPDVYYYGLLRPTQAAVEFCGSVCVEGYGYEAGTSPLQAASRVSVGLAFDDESAVRIMFRGLGFNHGRSRAPCSLSEGLDPDFPRADGSVGVWGYDFSSDRLIAPDRTDIMSHCPDAWVSAYTYGALLERVRVVNGIVEPEP